MNLAAKGTHEALSNMDFPAEVEKALGDYAAQVDGKKVAEACYERMLKVLSGRMV